MHKEIRDLILDKKLVKEFENSKVIISVETKNKRVVISNEKFDWIISQFYKMFRWGK